MFVETWLQQEKQGQEESQVQARGLGSVVNWAKSVNCLDLLFPLLLISFALMISSDPYGN